MSKIDRLELRRAIAEEIDEARAVSERVNSIPEVSAARAKAEASRRVADEDARAFSKVFNKYCKRDDELTAELLERHSDLFRYHDVDSDCRWIVRCVVTGLPIFQGDRVIEYRTGSASYERHLVLADAVTVDPELAQEPVVAIEAPDEEDAET